MEQGLKSGLNTINISKVWFFLFIIALFFPIRYVFPNISAFKTGAYSDFTSISLYLSDIFLFLNFGFLILPRGRSFYHVVEKFKYLIFWLILGLFWHFSTISSLNIWFFIKFLELIVLYGTAKILFFEEGAFKIQVIKLFSALGVIQALIAIAQFYNQASIGLNKLGEQIITPNILGVAKIVSDGTKYIRAYGTFPHPNLLSAFLVVTILFLVKLLLDEQKRGWIFCYISSLFISVIGLTLTFSRAGFLGLFVAILIFFGYRLAKNIEIKKTSWVLGLLIFFCVVAFLNFKPYLTTRATVSDQSSTQRSFYNQIALAMVKDKPLFGQGIGESVLHMQQYSPKKLWPWEIQPIHNYYLLSAAELGLPGTLILIWIIFFHLKSLFLKLKSDFSNYYLLVITLLVSFLVMMLFDHYFYTIQQTQMLFWLVLGLITADSTEQKGVA